MTRLARHRRLALSLTVWWLLITLALWLLGQALDQPAAPTACAASAGLLVAVGEAGDWLRRRWSAYLIERRSRSSSSWR
ncbi:hypothetical protein ACFSL4_24540 [Streptomyces caeni]|uniref:Uncharacterized protein n=1 Tax=Streptomyces caeni TaxID=2307231 RepID=A0ABW4IYD9_9ACTN